MRIHDIHIPALDRVPNVRGAHTRQHDLSPQRGGVRAISLGLSTNFSDDRAMLKHGKQYIRAS